MNGLKGYSPLEAGVLAALLVAGLIMCAFVLADPSQSWAWAFLGYAAVTILVTAWANRRRKARAR